MTHCLFSLIINNIIHDASTQNKSINLKKQNQNIENAMKHQKMKALIFNISPVRWTLCKIGGKIYENIYLSSLSGLKLTETDIPNLPDENWVLCKTRIGGICGTDLNTIFMNQHPASMIQNFVSFPMMLGHENVATIIETSSSVSEFHIGQRVIIDPSHSCAVRGINPPCRMCQIGKISSCENFDRGNLPPSIALGYNNFTGGSWAEYFIAHKNQIIPLPDEIADEQAILIDPLACSLHSVMQALPKSGEHILVFGAGIIALGIILAIRALNFNVKITATVRYPFQAELAKKCGADNIVFWSNKQRANAFSELADITNACNMSGKFGMKFLRGGFDKLYDCTGKINSLVDALRLVKPNGTAIIAGTPQLGLTDFTPVWFNEIKIIGTTGRAIETLPNEQNPKHNYQHIVELITTQKIDTSFIPIKFFRQQEYKIALSNLRNRSKFHIVKAAFDFRED